MKNLIFLVFAILLAVIPLFLHKESEFGGTDVQAKEVINEISPSYKPWAQSFWKPPGGEIESLLFSLQAAIGAGVFGYLFGFSRARKKYSNSGAKE